VESQREIRRDINLTKEEQECQKRGFTTRCNKLAESKVLKNHPYLVGKYDLSSNLFREDLIERQIIQMVNKEDTKCMFSILRFNINGSINPVSIVRSSVERSDITQQDVSTVT
jgi:hypothetical protein